MNGCAARFIIASVLALSTPIATQAQGCAKQAYPAFEFQVYEPAQAIPDSSHPHPAPGRYAPEAYPTDVIIVQFVVDTAGVPQPATLEILRSPTSQQIESIKAAFPIWRFTPPRQGKCVVAQIVQTALVR